MTLVQSMTGFGAIIGENQTHSWAAELRSVNGKGLDIKIRVPDWIDGLESVVRTRLKQLIKRGNVTLTIKLQSDENDQTVSLSLDQGILIKTLDNIAKIERPGFGGVGRFGLFYKNDVIFEYIVYYSEKKIFRSILFEKNSSKKCPREVISALGISGVGAC